MSVRIVTVQELLALHQVADFKIITGWSGRENYFSKITTTLSGEQVTGDALLVLNCRDLNSQEINSKIFEALKKTVAGIFLLATPEPLLTEDSITNASKAKIPIIYLPKLRRLQELDDAFYLTQSLKSKDFFFEYIKSSSSHLLNLINNKGISSLIEHLEATLGNPVIVTDSAFKNISSSEYGQKILLKCPQVFKHIKNAYHEKKLAVSGHNNQLWKNSGKIRILCDDTTTITCYVLELKNDTTVNGYLIIFEIIARVNQLDILQTIRAAPVIISEFIKQAEKIAIEKKYKESFIYDLLHNNFESHASLLKYGEIWGWNLSEPQQLIIMEVANHHSTENLDNDLFENLSAIIAGAGATFFKKPMISKQNEQLVIIVPYPEERTPKEHKKELRQLVNTIKDKIRHQLSEVSVSFGIGRLYPSITDLCRSYQEAKTALELGKFLEKSNSITHFEDLGIMQLLTSISHEQLADFCREYLDELIAFDEKNELSLLTTLHMYLKENGDFNVTAKKLFIHPNTLRYRIKKIEEILDLDLEKYENIINLLVALKINNMRKQGFGGFY